MQSSYFGVTVRYSRSTNKVNTIRNSLIRTFFACQPVGRYFEEISGMLFYQPHPLSHADMFKIFIIDDNEDFVLLFTQAVSKINPEIQCLSAENGYSALRQLKFMLPTLPDYIFVDVKMPIMNGHEIVAELKKQDQLAQVPIFMYSAQANPEDEAKARNAGVSAFFSKPASLETINMMIAAAMKARQ